MSLRGTALILTLTLSTPALIWARAVEKSPATRDQTSLVLRDLEGRKQDLRDFEGSIVIVNFWATWCIPCREEMPIFVSLQKRYAQRDVRVIAVSVDDPKSKDAVARFAQEMKINFPVWVGGTTQDMKRLGLGEALPATAVLDREGRIVGRILGPVEKSDLRKRIEWLLNAPPPVVDKLSGTVHDHADDPSHSHEGETSESGHHEGEEEHQHGGVGMEGASLVPS